MAPTEEFLTVRETRIQLFRGGRGRPLVILHGAGGGGWLRFHPLVQQARLDKIKSRQRSFEELVEDGFVILGSPATVTKQLRAHQQEMGFGIFCALLHFGTLPHDLTMRNLELFAKEVTPHFRSSQLSSLGERKER